MRKICFVLSMLGLWLAVSGFASPDGFYTVDIPPGWRLESKDGDFIFRQPNDYAILYFSVIGLPDNIPSLTYLLQYLVPDDDTITEQRNYPIAGQTCLYVATRGINERNVHITGRSIVCYVPNRAAASPTHAFYARYSYATSVAAQYEQVFWNVIRSLRWGSTGAGGDGRTIVTTPPSTQQPAAGGPGRAEPYWTYSWSPNVAPLPFNDSRQQGETALATDTRGRVWLSFIDGGFRKNPTTGISSIWPRKLRLFVSSNGGKSFTIQPDLTKDRDSGGDQALAASRTGEVYVSYVLWPDSEFSMARRRIVLRRLDVLQNPNDACLPRDDKTNSDMSNVHIGINGVVHIVGVDINVLRDGPPYTNLEDKLQLLYARSLDGGRTCVNQQRLLLSGHHPQIVDTEFGLLVIDHAGFYPSADHGVSFFSSKVMRAFAQRTPSAAVSLDRRTVYVVGDSAASGLLLHVTSDGGVTWRVGRVDNDSTGATAWRYPAVHVDSKNRIHVVWMDDRSGFGAVYHANSDNAGVSFSQNTRVSDKPFRFPAKRGAMEDGTWAGDYLSLTTVGDQVVVAWGDQREGTPKSVVQTSVGNPILQCPRPLSQGGCPASAPDLLTWPPPRPPK